MDAVEKRGVTGPAPAVSVVMPVYNKSRFIDAAVTSILRQTFSDFEFVILDDGSSDGSRERLRHWAAADARIRLIEGGRNSGPVASSNRVVAEARAPLIARMDGDDFAFPERLAMQVALMEAETEAVLVGSLAVTIDTAGRLLRAADLARLTRPSPFPPFPHPTIMFRREAFDRIGGYRAEAARWEDVDFGRRMAAAGRVLVISRPLVAVRLSGANSRLAAGRAASDEAMDAMYRTLGGGAPDPDGRLLPAAFLPTAAIDLWQGRRPRVLGKLLKRGRLRADRASATALIWAAWADAAPKSLRLVLRLRLALANRIARRRLAGAAFIAWRPEPDDPRRSSRNGRRSAEIPPPSVGPRP